MTCTDKVLEAVLRLDTARFGDVGIHDPPAWYFVHRGSTPDVIPSSPDLDHYVVDVETLLQKGSLILYIYPDYY